MSIDAFYQHLNKGNLSEADRIAAMLYGEERDEAELIMAVFKLNNFGPGPVAPFVNRILSESQNIPRIHSMARIVSAGILFWQAKYEEAQAELEIAENLLIMASKNSEKGTRHIKAILLLFKGVIHHGLVDINDDLVLKNYQKALEICFEEGFPLKILVATIYNNISVFYKRKGDWPIVIEYNQKILDLCDRIGNQALQLYPLIQLGIIQFVQGDLALAQELFQKALHFSEQYPDKRGAAWALENLGAVHQSKGEFQNALDCYQRALQLTQSIKLAGGADLSAIYYRLFQLQLAMESSNQAQEYLRKLQEQSQIDQSLNAQIHFQMAKALFLRTSQRFKDKAQAQDLFRTVMENKGTSEGIRFLAMLHLCDLLLQEVKVSGEEKLLVEVQTITDYVIEQAQVWKFAPDLINTFILKAKFLLITGAAQEASNILKEALQIAEDRALIYLADQVRKEQENLKDELKKWKEFTERNASLQERLAFAELEDYLQMAIKMRDLKADPSK